MVEEIPAAVILEDAVMCCPADNGCQYDSLISEWAIGIVTDSIAEEM